MKKLPESLDHMLLDYLDEKSTPAQRKHIEQLLATEPAVKARFDMLASMDTLLQQADNDEPSRNFTQQVMARLDQYPAPPRTSFTFFHGILLGAGVLVAIALAALVGTGSTLR